MLVSVVALDVFITDGNPTNPAPVSRFALVSFRPCRLPGRGVGDPRNLPELMPPGQTMSSSGSGARI
jgi:hypothetical protein